MTYIAVISSGRPGAPYEMRPHLGVMEATWFVGEGEGDDYALYARPQDTIIEGGGLCQSRNAALREAFRDGKECLQISDDLKKLERLQLGNAGTAPMTLGMAIVEMRAAMKETGAKLAGVAPTNNPFYASRKVNDHGFCVGDLILVAPSQPGFDEDLRLKEDYDFTAQHLAAYGKVARCDWILASFAHRTNRGGAVAYRTTELEQATIAQLKAKWPEAIRDNPKRPDEILFKWPKDAFAQAQAAVDGLGL